MISIHKHLVKIFGLLSLLVQCSCVSLFAPDFVQEEIKKSEKFKIDHADTFHVIKGDSRDLGYTQLGKAKAPKIIFVHGSPGNWGAFIEQLNRPVLPTQANIISVDRLGYGDSARGGVEKSLELQARAVMKVLDSDDPNQPVILVGHSYGGPVVVKMATFKDPRIKSVLVLAGAVDPSLEKTSWYQYPADWWIFRWMLPTDLITCNREIMALKPELEVMSKQWDQITARMTVVQGLKDELVDPKNADFIEEKAKALHPKIIRLELENHFLQAYQNDLIERILLDELVAISIKK